MNREIKFRALGEVNIKSLKFIKMFITEWVVFGDNKI